MRSILMLTVTLALTGSMPLAMPQKAITPQQPLESQTVFGPRMHNPNIDCDRDSMHSRVLWAQLKAGLRSKSGE